MQTPYHFFLRHAGSSYDPKTQTPIQGRIYGARRLAKAEKHARVANWTYEWQDDWTIGDHSKEFDCYEPSEGPETCESCLLYDADGKVIASLGCIDDATPEYRRVIEAELALEAMPEEV